MCAYLLAEAETPLDGYPRREVVGDAPGEGNWAAGVGGRFCSVLLEFYTTSVRNLPSPP